MAASPPGILVPGIAAGRAAIGRLGGQALWTR
jgi:hypothetical protein